jgi:hypothetical protein
MRLGRRMVLVRWSTHKVEGFLGLVDASVGVSDHMVPSGWCHS